MGDMHTVHACYVEMAHVAARQGTCLLAAAAMGSCAAVEAAPPPPLPSTHSNAMNSSMAAVGLVLP